MIIMLNVRKVNESQINEAQVKYNGIDENSYKEYYEKSFISRDEQFYAYRNVKAEKFADDFAINFINENISQLWKIVDENTSEEEIEFYLE